MKDHTEESIQKLELPPHQAVRETESHELDEESVSALREFFLLLDKWDHEAQDKPPQELPMTGAKIRRKPKQKTTGQTWVNNGSIKCRKPHKTVVCDAEPS
jgi:hypothetical protein